MLARYYQKHSRTLNKLYELLEAVNGANVTDSPALFDKIKTNLEALKTTGINEGQAGPSLILAALKNYST